MSARSLVIVYSLRRPTVPLPTSPPTVHDQSNDPFSEPQRPVRTTSPRRLPDLPPVEPPSAGFVVQLFVIPAVVVVVVIIVWLLFGKLAGGERDAMEYVRQLRSPTANWRLCLRAGQPDPARSQDRQRSRVARRTDGPALPRARQARRRPQADPVRRLDAGGLQDARGQDGERAERRPARSAGPGPRAQVSDHDPDRRRRQPGQAGGPHERPARRSPARSRPWATAATTGEPEVRQMAVYALGFFGGPSATELLRERLQADEDRFVRYNAAVALARRGDPAAAGTLREMLSTADLNKVIDLPGDDREAEQDRGDRARGARSTPHLDRRRHDRARPSRFALRSPT